MDTVLPNDPFRVPDDTPICDRLDMMSRLADQGVSYPSVQKMASDVLARAKERCDQFQQASKTDAGMHRAMCSQNVYERLIALEALKAVQSLPYVSGPPDEEWMQGPDWTIHHGGECKALTVLLVSIERMLGLDAEPFWITQNGQSINHVTSRVALDGHWFWSDPSIRGAMLGESPYEAEERLDSGVSNGVISPAGKAGGGGHGGHGGHGGYRGSGFPFGWWGWGGLWSGWPNWWWCNNYPYLCTSYGNLISNPYAYGFYPYQTQYILS